MVSAKQSRIYTLITHNHGRHLSFNLNSLLSLTRTDCPEIPQMSIDIHTKISFIPLQVQVARQHINVRLLDSDIIPTSNIVLWGDMPVPQQRRRQLGHRIILVRNTVCLSLPRRSNIIRHTSETNLGRTICVQIDSHASRAKIARCKTSQGATQTMSRSHNLVAGILLPSRVQS